MSQDLKTKDYVSQDISRQLISYFQTNCFDQALIFVRNLVHAHPEIVFSEETLRTILLTDFEKSDEKDANELGNIIFSHVPYSPSAIHLCLLNAISIAKTLAFCTTGSETVNQSGLVSINEYLLPARLYSKDFHDTKVKFTYLDLIDPTILFVPIFYNNQVSTSEIILDSSEAKVEHYSYSIIGDGKSKIPGYLGKRCIIDYEMALELKRIQQQLKSQGPYTLKVFDAYRPAQAVEFFYQWGKTPEEAVVKKFHHPEITKEGLHGLYYLAKVSSHSKGCAVDLTIAEIDKGVSDSTLRPEGFLGIFDENELDMGVGYLAFDIRSSHYTSRLTDKQQQNRKLLTDTMEEAGFEKLFNEFWHYFYKQERNKNTIFDFPIKDNYEVIDGIITINNNHLCEAIRNDVLFPLISAARVAYQYFTNPRLLEYKTKLFSLSNLIELLDDTIKLSNIVELEKQLYAEKTINLTFINIKNSSKAYIKECVLEAMSNNTIDLLLIKYIDNHELYNVQQIIDCIMEVSENINISTEVVYALSRVTPISDSLQKEIYNSICHFICNHVVIEDKNVLTNILLHAFLNQHLKIVELMTQLCSVAEAIMKLEEVQQTLFSTTLSAYKLFNEMIDCQEIEEDIRESSIEPYAKIIGEAI